MSVLIKGMEMPKNCCDCDFEAYPRGVHYCLLKKRAVESLERPDWCPLEELPTAEKHGKWIDKGDYAICSECGERSGV